jgi:hypothetical protein
MSQGQSPNDTLIESVFSERESAMRNANLTGRLSEVIDSSVQGVQKECNPWVVSAP